MGEALGVEGSARAPYASVAGGSRGRLYPEPPSPSRSDFRRDCDRIIHSTAFRRLAHKTQVFVYHEGDHYRTRLTHTLEVVQIARSIARGLRLDEDLAEACALGHDLGHPPFGHAGERALDRCLAEFGGFDHNAQTLRVVTALERRYPQFDGLNLTWETLEGLVKHNGPLCDRTGQPVPRYRERGIPQAITEYSARHDLDLSTYPSAEAQAGALADDIAYDAHDIDDGLRADLFGLADLESIPLVGDILKEVDRQHPHIEVSHRAHELIRRLITRMVEEVFAESGRRLGALSSPSVAAIRAAAAPMVAFSPAMAEADRAIKAFLLPRMYRHDRVMGIMSKAERVVEALFARYLDDAADMPAEWQANIGSADRAGRARRVADFIAGMTDRYAIAEHTRLFGSTPDLR